MSVILTIALLLQPLPEPRNVQWEALSDGEATYDFIDPGTIVREGDIVSYTSRLTDPVGGQDGPTIMVIRHARNCRTGQEGFLGIDAYDANGHRFASRRTQMRDVEYRAETPGTRALMVQQRVCGALAD
jgi:hypothetical protein